MPTRNVLTSNQSCNLIMVTQSPGTIEKIEEKNVDLHLS